jgi:hypothetical protein
MSNEIKINKGKAVKSYFLLKKKKAVGRLGMVLGGR